VFVWGGIIVLLLLVGAQARARFGYTMTLNALQDRIAEDEGPNARQLLLSEVDSHLVGWPSQSRKEESPHRGSILLSWRGLTTSYEITLPFDPSETDPAIIGLETKDAPTIEEEMAAAESAEPTGGPPATMPGMASGPGMHGASPGGPPGPGGPGGGRDPMANDADGDGKLSREEAQGRLQENFEAADADADGFLVLDEITAWREANPRPQSDDGEPVEGATPEPGESTATENPDESTPAEGAAPDAGSPESGDEAAETPETPASEPADPDAPGETTAEPEGETSESTPDSTPEA
jgi:hypothetical protein